MKILFFGMGAAGKRHADLIGYLYPHYSLYALRRTHCEEYGEVTNLYNMEQIIILNPDVCFICNPTHIHLSTLALCIKLKSHVFIEKPIDIHYDGLDTQISLLRRKGLKCYIAYPLRHNPRIRETKARLGPNIKRIDFVCHSDLSKWRNYKTYSSRQSEGGGAILELSHELDLAQYFLGPIEKLTGLVGKTKGTYTTAEDWASIIAEHKGGRVSSHNLDINARTEQRYFYYDGNLINYQSDEMTYTSQIEYFFNNLKNSKLESEINQSVLLFKLIVDFRNETFGNYLCPRGVKGPSRKTS